MPAGLGDLKMLEALFVATANAAPAATAAANNGDDWKWLVPVATLLLGFGLKWVQDHVTEKARQKRDDGLRRQQRYDALRMRRLEAERANLLALQPLVVAFMRAATDAYKVKMKAFGEGGGAAAYLPGSSMERDVALQAMAKVNGDVRQSSAAIIPLQSRLHSAEVRTALNELIDVVWTTMDSKTSLGMMRNWQLVDQPHNELHTMMGRIIKQLEDENLQLGDPPEK